MLHNQISSALRSSFLPVFPTSSAPSHLPAERSLRLVDPLVPLPDTGRLEAERGRPRFLADALSALAQRFAAFCAEASVLVFVLGILDRFLLKERIEMGWVFGAFGVSVGLLALSVGTDVAARRWLKQRRLELAQH